MDLTGSFAISASGMAVERTRLDVVALNLANVNSARPKDGSGYQPLQVISGARRAPDFGSILDGVTGSGVAGARAFAGGAQVHELRALATPPRLVHEPAHPDADARGYVAYPGIDPVREMVTMIGALRAYEANVAAANAARTMAQRALELGGN